jgi:EF hand domain-containing protein
MPTIKQAVAILLGAFVLSSTAYAEDAKSQGGVSRDLDKQFKALDRNGDGFLSREELAGNKAFASGFKDADKNGDGKLDMSEFQALEANSSQDRSLGSVAPGEDRTSGAGGTAEKPRSSEAVRQLP